MPEIRMINETVAGQILRRPVADETSTNSRSDP